MPTTSWSPVLPRSPLMSGTGRGLAATFVASAIALFGLVDVASAQSPSQRGLAEMLFQEGRRLMGQGHYAEACPKLQESHRLDPGGGTLLNLAVCHESEGKTATAWAEFNEAQSLARRDGRADRVKVAADHLAALEPRLSRLTVRLSAELATVAIDVRIDGLLMPRAALGMAMPLDPGSHQLVASAPGKQPWHVEVKLDAASDAKSVLVPPLVDQPGTSPEAGPTDTKSEATPSSQRTSTDAKTVAYVAGGVGVAALGIGTFYGIRAISKRHSSDEQCDSRGCSSDGVELNHQAQDAAVLSDIGFGIGLAGIGTALWIWLSHPSAPATNAAQQRPIRLEPQLGRTSGSVTLTGAF